MERSKRFAYSMLVAAMALVPVWGCSTEPPKPPADVDASDTDPVSIELPTDEASDSGDAGSSESEGSDSKDAGSGAKS